MNNEKKISPNVIRQLSGRSAKAQVCFFHAFLMTDRIGVLDLNNHPELKESKDFLSLFPNQIKSYKNFIIFKNYIHWNYRQLRKHNSHSLAWKDLEKLKGFYYDDEKNEIMFPNGK